MVSKVSTAVSSLTNSISQFLFLHTQIGICCNCPSEGFSQRFVQNPKMGLICNSLRTMMIEIFLKVFPSPLHIFFENVLFHSIVCFLKS